MSNIDEYTIDEGYEKTELAKAPFIQYLRELTYPYEDKKDMDKDKCNELYEIFLTKYKASK